MTLCKLCQQPGLEPWLDFGDQALTNRFLHSQGELEYVHPLALGVCEQCGLVQLTHVAPPAEVRSRFPWLSYNESENHLDDLVRRVVHLANLGADSLVAGLSYKDESTLRRLQEHGLATWLVDPQSDLGIDHPLGGIESIQQRLTRDTVARLVERRGQADVVILRHVLEHAHDLLEVLGSLRDLLTPTGYLILEVPDAARALDRCDYSTVWEEHVFYFTQATLLECLARTGFETVFLHSYFSTHENSLVAIVRPTDCCSPVLTSDDVHAEVERLRSFRDRYPIIQARLTDLLRRRSPRGKVAMLGAGHLSAAFINLLGLEGLIDFVADDNPHKQGLFMPGSRLPILGSGQLVERDVRLCLMTVRPEVEEVVVRKNQAFTDRGGCLASIFPDSPHALPAA